MFLPRKMKLSSNIQKQCIEFIGGTSRTFNRRQQQQQCILALSSLSSSSSSLQSSPHVNREWSRSRHQYQRWSLAATAALSMTAGSLLAANVQINSSCEAAQHDQDQREDDDDGIEAEIAAQITSPGIIKGIKNPMTVYVKHAIKREASLRRKATEKEVEQQATKKEEQRSTPQEQQQQKIHELIGKWEEQQQQKKLQAQASSPIGNTLDLVNATEDKITKEEELIAEKARKAKQHSGGLKIFSGNGNMALAMEICKSLGINLGKATVGRFADGEVNVVIKENVRGKDVYIIQPTCTPVNDNLMELLLMISTMRRASARRITVVIPYYGYARQDRKMQARVPISAADVARLMESMGVDRVIAVDLHCGQIQGFFGPRVPVDNLDGGIVGLDYFGSKDLHNPVVVSPDAGGVYRAKKFKEGLESKYEMKDLGLAMIVKQRARAGLIDQMDLVGDVKDCDCILVDDMIDTAGTLCKAADVLAANGARRVFAFASHGLLSGPGNHRIANSIMEEVVILNTIPTSPQRHANEKLTELSVAPLLAQTIFNVHAKKSISALFK